MSLLNNIPVVDFKDCLSCENLSKCPQVLELHAAFSQVGFVYLKNHGVDMEVVNRAKEEMMKFFTLPLAVKRKYRVNKVEVGNNLSGYYQFEQEGSTLDGFGDLKENFDVYDTESCTFPTQEIPKLKTAMLDFYQAAKTCAFKILTVIGHALIMEDPEFFVKRHQGTGTENSFTSIRVNHYPAIPPSTVIEEGRLRCGEHVDYGTITLLFPSPVGGLQVKKRNGGYIDVPYLEDAVLINLGAIMQRWTGDTYMATPHRVLVPPDDMRNKTRQTIAIFMHPDKNEMIECIDGSNKYPPILACDDTQQRVQDTIKSVEVL